MSTFRVNWAGGKTLVYTLIVFILCVVLLSSALSLPAIQKLLPAQHYGTQYPIFEESLAGIEAHVAEVGHIDCIFLGSSMTQSAVYPEVFQTAYRQQTGEDISCFNFAMWGLTGSSAGALAETLVSKYQPHLLVYATAARDYHQNSDIPGEHDFPRTPWVRYRRGSFNLRGWLTDKLILARYYNTLHNQIFPDIQDISTFVVTHDAQGFRPVIEQHPVFLQALLSGPVDEQPDSDAQSCCDYVIDHADLEGLRQILALQDDSLSILIYEAPIHPLGISRNSLNDLGQQVFLDTVTQETQDRGIPFWKTSHLPLVPDADWQDFLHFRITGAIQFSQWIGVQIGEAVNLGLFENPVPLSLLQEPPLPDYEPDEPPYYLQSDGLLPATHDAYMDHLAQYDLTAPDAIILNPSSGLDSRQSLQMQLGFYIDWAAEVDESMVENLFDFRVVLDRMQFEAELSLGPQSQQALDQWRNTKQADDLAAAGIDYLIYSHEWLSFTTEEEASILADAAQYELVASWNHKVSKQQYWLYRIVK